MNKEFVNIISNKGVLRGVLHYPNNYNEAKKYGIVIVTYGLNGNRSDFHSILCDLANNLQLIDFFCIRYDYYGSGTSDGFFYECNVDTKTEDTLKIFEYISSLKSIDKKRIYTLTFSDGIQIALEACNKNKNYLKQSFIFWSPYIVPADESEQNTIMTRPVKARDRKTVIVPLCGTWISLNYIEQKRRIDFISRLKDIDMCHGRIFYYYAADDTIVTNSLRLLENYKNMKGEKVNGGGGHCYCSYLGHKEVIEKTIQKIKGKKYDK